MSERKKRKIEFIESYWTGGELGSDYQWSDNHGELVRCKDCDKAKVLSDHVICCNTRNTECQSYPLNWYCADGERR